MNTIKLISNLIILVCSAGLSLGIQGALIKKAWSIFMVRVFSLPAISVLDSMILAVLLLLLTDHHRNVERTTKKQTYDLIVRVFLRYGILWGMLEIYSRLLS